MPPNMARGQRSRPFSRGRSSSRGFSQSRGSSQSRGFSQSRGSSQSRGFNQSRSESNFRGQSFDSRRGRGSFRSTRGARGSFRSTRGARGSFQTTRGSFETSRGARGSFRGTRGFKPYSDFNPPHEKTPNKSQSNYENAQQRMKGTKRKTTSSLTHPRRPKQFKGDSLEKNERTIFVGNVPLRTTQADLKKLFEKYGTIESTRFRSVPRGNPRELKKVAFFKGNFHPQRDSMNAYVVFATKDEAERAQEMNGHKLIGHCLRVNMSTRKQSEDDKNSIFVGNLPFDVKDDELHQAFEDCGPIESAQVMRDAETSMGRGFGFVNFTSPDGVELALQMENVQIRKQILRIKRVNANKQVLKGTTDWISVKIDNLPLTTTKALLIKEFSGCGDIINITFNVKSVREKIAFIAFRTPEAANKALRVRLVINKRTLLIKKDPFDPHKHIFVRNVPLKAKKTHVKSVLDKCGVIKRCKLLLTPLPPFTAGSGIVEFETLQGAQNALELGTFKILDNDVTVESYISKKVKGKDIENDDDGDTDDDSSEEQNGGENADDDDESDNEENEQDMQLGNKNEDDDDEDEDSEQSDDINDSSEVEDELEVEEELEDEEEVETDEDDD